jgi:hypothetical protein
MRRAMAILMVAFFSLTLISPALFASNKDSNLPACCRRSGLHHCTAGNQADSSSGPALQQGRCPVYPSARAVPVSRTNGHAKVFAAVDSPLVSYPSSRPQTQALYRASLGRAGLERGPPAA